MSTDSPTSTTPHPPERDDEPSPDETGGLSAPIHRNDDGDPLALSMVLSPDQIAALNIDDSVDNVRPVIRRGTIHLVPDDG